MDLEILPTLNLFCSHETRRHLLHHKSNFPCARAVAPCDLPCPFPDLQRPLPPARRPLLAPHTPSPPIATVPTSCKSSPPLQDETGLWAPPAKLAGDFKPRPLGASEVGVHQSTFTAKSRHTMVFSKAG